MQRAVTRVAKRRPAAAATGGESKEKLTRFDPDVWGGVSLYAKTMGLNDTQAINDLLRVGLRTISAGTPAAAVHSAPTMDLADTAPLLAEMREQRVVLETLERLASVSLAVSAGLHEAGRPPLMRGAWALDEQRKARRAALTALGLSAKKDGAA